MDVLSELFGSKALVKIIRLFYLNPEEVFDAWEIARRTRSSLGGIRRGLRILERINFVKEAHRAFGVSNRSKKTKKKIVRGWAVNTSFAYLRPLKNMVLNAAPVDRDGLISRLKKCGRLTLVVLSGIFVSESSVDENGGLKADMLIVGDGMKKSVLDRVIHSVEAQLGKELNYSMLSSKEFFYRLRMRDKFIRDILDYPHEKILNKLDI